MVSYEVRFVDDAALPEGIDWALARTAVEMVAFIKESRITAAVLMEVWGAYRLLHQPSR